MPVLAGAVSTPRASATTGGRPNPTQKLDQSLVERYKAHPRAFGRATFLNLLVALALFVLGGILVLAGVEVVTIRGGGLALALMGLFPTLLGLAALDEVRWRRALVARKGVPLPPRPPLRALLRSLRSKSAPAKPAPTPSKGS